MIKTGTYWYARLRPHIHTYDVIEITIDNIQETYVSGYEECGFRHLFRLSDIERILFSERAAAVECTKLAQSNDPLYESRV